MFPDSIREKLQSCPFESIAKMWKILEESVPGNPTMAWLGRNDRFYLAVRILHRVDLIHPWVYARCREVEANPNGYLDLWAREHAKSSLITCAGIIQEIIKNPEITIGIFSHTKPISKAFLTQIQREFETNELLKSLYPDVLYDRPEKESPSWSQDVGIIVKRQGNPKEKTIEAWGLVDGMPTSKHFQLMVYDDVVTQASVSTPEQIQKTTQAWELSDNLGVAGGRRWMIGTRYSYADTYETILERKAAIPRIYPATDDGTITGTPVFFSQEVWDEKVLTQGPATVSCQLLQNPLSGMQRMFDVEDFRIYEVRPEILNVYITIDPARSKKKGSDKTAMAVIGIDYASNKYLLDGFNHKMDLAERWQKTAMLYHKWKRVPGVQNLWVGYEAFGAQADLDFFAMQMAMPADQGGGHFPILELMWPRDGEGSKVDRVQRLTPDLRKHKFFLPYETDPGNLTSTQRKFAQTGYKFRLAAPIKRKDESGKIYDLSKDLRLQTHFFPFGGKVDLIDAVSRIFDMEPRAPSYAEPSYLEPQFI